MNDAIKIDNITIVTNDKSGGITGSYMVTIPIIWRRQINGKRLHIVQRPNTEGFIIRGDQTKSPQDGEVLVASRNMQKRGRNNGVIVLPKHWIDANWPNTKSIAA